MSAESAAECMAEVQNAAAHVRRLSEELPALGATRVLAEHNHSKAYSAAMVRHKSERTDITRALAEIDTEATRLAFEQAKAEEVAAKAALRSWQSVLSALQTVTTAFREEARFSRTGPGY